MDTKAKSVNSIGTVWNPENGNFSFQTLVQMGRGHYNLSDALISCPLFGFKPSENKHLTSDEKNVIEQVKRIASSTGESLPSGLDAVFDLMSYADTSELSPHTMSNLGFFLKDIVSLMVHLNHLEANCYYALLSDERLKNNNKAGV